MPARGPLAVAALGAALLVSLIAAASRSEPTTRAVRPLKSDAFARYVEADGHPRLECSIVTLKGDDGFTVDLVSAVHIADASFYEDLNKRFTGYDSVLFEMVSSKNGPAAPVKGKKSNSPVSLLQRGMKTMLGLTFQLDEVDYSKPNFVHADMDVDSFLEAQEARGESLFGLMLKAYLAEMDKPATRTSTGKVFKPVDFGTTPETRKRAIKLLFAQQLGDLERQSLQLDGPDGSAILTDRNDACLKVLRAQREAGKKRVAIFYGAAHMPDLTEKLTTVDKLKPTKTEWLTAWNIAAVPPSPATQPATK